MNSTPEAAQSSPHLPATGAPSEEPVPGSAYKRTPLQQLRPWDHQELAGPAPGNSRHGGGRRAPSPEGAGVSPLGTLVLTALVAVIGLGLMRRR
ncbi:hypothetical protein [Acidovorax sp. FG27]|uniref:hypothetical protein n=1 Tax=Acidovorax sp. FG27 TaxID=3133652 RepID=UPI0033406DDD